MTSPIKREEHPVTAADLVQKAKDLIHEGNVRRLMVKNDQGHTVIELPLTAGLVGVLLAPALAALGGIAALAGHYTLVVDRRPVDAPALQIGKAPPAP